ncbi:UPF0602 protein C4orf47-like [Pollicipes pollicipes]|uniref:UPF0602 protein C4orf47-like n=1 Tax=Pollicipes pollicipes TaxID=41117 RepID=UPI001884E1C9|nr:UPF0602 protein C4orf47-like [Pollicipes pollicipes]
MGSKTCQERVGLFKEMSYLHTGGWGISKPNQAFNDQATRGLQMLPGGSKERAANQDGYFCHDFERVFDGEAWASAWTTDKLMDRRVRGRGKQVGARDWLPSSHSKDANGAGTYYGTFISHMPAMDPNPKGRGPLRHEPPNVKTNPSKKGTGYGYANVALNPYPEHANESFAEALKMERQVQARHRQAMLDGPLRLKNYPQDYFGPDPYIPVTAGRTYNIRRIPASPKEAFRPSGPAKKDGGCKAGCFSKFPEYMPDVYGMRVRYPQNVVNKDGKTFYPPMRGKSVRQDSIVNTNVARSIHEQSWRNTRNIVFKKLCSSVGL